MGARLAASTGASPRLRHASRHPAAAGPAQRGPPAHPPPPAPRRGGHPTPAGTAVPRNPQRAGTGAPAPHPPVGHRGDRPHRHCPPAGHASTTGAAMGQHRWLWQSPSAPWPAWRRPWRVGGRVKGRRAAGIPAQFPFLLLPPQLFLGPGGRWPRPPPRHAGEGAARWAHSTLLPTAALRPGRDPCRSSPPQGSARPPAMASPGPALPRCGVPALGAAPAARLAARSWQRSPEAVSPREKPGPVPWGDAGLQAGPAAGTPRSRHQRGRRQGWPPLPQHLSQSPGRSPPPPAQAPPRAPDTLGRRRLQGRGVLSPRRAAGAEPPVPLTTLASQQGARWPWLRCVRMARKSNLHKPPAAGKEDGAAAEAARPAPARHTAQPQARAGRLVADSWFSPICRKEPAAAGAQGLSGSGKAPFRGALAAAPRCLPRNHIKAPAPSRAGGAPREHPGTGLSCTANTPRRRRGPGDGGVAGLRCTVTAGLLPRCHRALSPSAGTATGQGVAVPQGPPGLPALARGPAPAGTATGATEPHSVAHGHRAAPPSSPPGLGTPQRGAQPGPHQRCPHFPPVFPVPPQCR